jgi:hypothetical protein
LAERDGLVGNRLYGFLARVHEVHSALVHPGHHDHQGCPRVSPSLLIHIDHFERLANPISPAIPLGLNPPSFTCTARRPRATSPVRSSRPRACWNSSPDSRPRSRPTLLASSLRRSLREPRRTCRGLQAWREDQTIRRRKGKRGTRWLVGRDKGGARISPSERKVWLFFCYLYFRETLDIPWDIYRSSRRASCHLWLCSPMCMVASGDRS